MELPGQARLICEYLFLSGYLHLFVISPMGGQDLLPIILGGSYEVPVIPGIE